MVPVAEVVVPSMWRGKPAPVAEQRWRKIGAHSRPAKEMGSGPGSKPAARDGVRSSPADDFEQQAEKNRPVPAGGNEETPRGWSRDEKVGSPKVVSNRWRTVVIDPERSGRRSNSERFRRKGARHGLRPIHHRRPARCPFASAVPEALGVACRGGSPRCFSPRGREPGQDCPSRRPPSGPRDSALVGQRRPPRPRRSG